VAHLPVGATGRLRAITPQCADAHGVPCCGLEEIAPGTTGYSSVAMLGLKLDRTSDTTTNCVSDKASYCLRIVERPADLPIKEQL